jgi:Raf kinase inhibitor-like YbhB/YbcL family protein
MKEMTFEELSVKSNAFENYELIPTKYTARGKDVSPDFIISNISTKAKSIAIIMDDLDHPIGTYNHWVIWNIPIQDEIPEAIPHGRKISTLGDAIQGIGYGKHKYRGPNPPFFFKQPHRYKFNVYTLDSMLDISTNSRKKQLLKGMERHILQHGVLLGKFKNK